MELLAIYCALFLGMGIYEYVKRKDFSEFVVAGRRYSSSAVGISIAASCVGASATIGVTGLAFSIGTPAFWWLGSGAVGLLVLSTFLARKVRSSDVYTLPDMAERFISPSARKLMALIIIPAWGSILAAQYIAAAKVAVALSGMEYTSALAAGALFIIGYTALGGQNSILKSDVVQYGLVVAGLLLALFYAGSASSVSIADMRFEFLNEGFPLSKWTYFMIIVGGSYVVCPMLFGRLFSAKDENAARRGSYMSVAVIALTAVVIVCIGYYARGLAPAGIDTDTILTQVIPGVMPSWAGIALLFSLLSTIISSADSCLITAATVMEHDLIGGQSVSRCRLLMVGIGLGALVVAKSGGSILSLLLAANDIYVCGVVAPMTVAILSFGRRAINARFMLLAIVVGGCLGVVAATTGDKMYSYLGVGVSLCLSLVSLLESRVVAENR